jgi:signal transduction histidine kinase
MILKLFNLCILWILLQTGGGKGPEVLRVGVPDNPPLAVRGQTGRPEGVAIDLLEAVARRENWVTEYHYGPDVNLLAQLARGEIDVIAGMPGSGPLPGGIRAGREVLVNDWITLYSRSGRMINNPGDLEGAIIGYYVGDPAGPVLELFLERLNVQVSFYPLPVQPVQSFPEGRFDYFADNRLEGSFRFRDSDWHETGFVGYPVAQTFLFPMAETPFEATIEGYLGRWKRERGSPWYRILETGLGGRYREVFPLWFWIIVIFSGILFLFLSLILFFSLLRREVAAKTRELKVASERAVAADRLKTIFLANMSHEIRSPLNAIVGFARLLSEPDMDHERRKSYVEIINANSRQLLYLISDILDFSRIESGEVELFFQKISVRDMAVELQQNFERYRDQIGRNALVFVSRFPDNDESEINTDPVRLKQVLTNLLNNAFKFTETGEIEFGYSSPFRDRDSRLKITFTVRDTGIGIPENKLGEIFDRFRQVDEGFSRRFSGAGLGLTISRKLVEMLDGDIRVDSRVGGGSVFSVTIPLIHERLTH